MRWLDFKLRDVETRKFFEKPPESASPFLEELEFWKKQPERV
jgi:hypothetical protein